MIMIMTLLCSSCSGFFASDFFFFAFCFGIVNIHSLSTSAFESSLSIPLFFQRRSLHLSRKKYMTSSQEGTTGVTVGADTLVGIPNSTLYIQNLNERARIKDLKHDLTKLFSPFGHIHNIIAKRNVKLRGQGFIIFDNIESATKALHSLQGYVLYMKSMVIKYAKFKSDVTAERLGILAEEKQKRALDKEEKAKHPRLTRRQLMQQLLASQAMQGLPMLQTLPTLGSDFSLPNKILFVQNLPLDITEDLIVNLFSKYPGFKEVRLVPTKKDIAFVEFENEIYSNTARLALDRHKINQVQEIRVNFAKK